MVNVSNVNTQHREVINLVLRVCRIDGRVTNVEENKWIVIKYQDEDFVNDLVRWKYKESILLILLYRQEK